MYRKEHKKCEFGVHEVYGIDILISTGDGKGREKDSRTTIYKRTDSIYSLKMKASRGESEIAIFLKMISNISLYLSYFETLLVTL